MSHAPPTSQNEALMGSPQRKRQLAGNMGFDGSPTL